MSGLSKRKREESPSVHTLELINRRIGSYISEEKKRELGDTWMVTVEEILGAEKDIRKVIILFFKI